MMPVVSMPSLAAISFPDQRVDLWQLSDTPPTLEIHVSGAWLASAGGHELGPSRLAIAGWKAIVFEEYEPSEKLWRPQTPPSGLKDLCEVEFSDELVLLRGFAQATGLWTQVRIVRPSSMELHSG